jgi:hypothetical protein
MLPFTHLLGRLSGNKRDYRLDAHGDGCDYCSSVNYFPLNYNCCGMQVFVSANNVREISDRVSTQFRRH